MLEATCDSSSIATGAGCFLRGEDETREGKNARAGMMLQHMPGFAFGQDDRSNRPNFLLQRGTLKAAMTVSPPRTPTFRSDGSDEGIPASLTLCSPTGALKKKGVSPRGMPSTKTVAGPPSNTTWITPYPDESGGALATAIGALTTPFELSEVIGASSDESGKSLALDVAGASASVGDACATVTMGSWIEWRSNPCVSAE